jgi:hypothetical protein
MAFVCLLATAALSSAALGRRQLLTQGALCGSALLASSCPSHATVAFDMTRYGDRELQIATINRLKQRVRDSCRASPELVPSFFELAIADALDYDRLKGGAGGLDGSIRYAKLLPPPLASGLAEVDRLQRLLVAQTEVTFADMLAYAGGQSIEVVSGVKV